MARNDPADQRLQRIRMIIGTVVGAIVLLVVAGGLYYAAGGGSGDYVEGTHWEVLENPEPGRPDTPIRVTEFFSYACIHCKAFDPALDAWVEALPDDVAFERTPVVFNAQWRILAQSFYALQAGKALEENHTRVFDAIHEQNRRFASLNEMAEFFDGHGTTQEEFSWLFRSAEIRREVAAAEAAAVQAGVRAVPTLVVDGRYRINVGSTGRADSLQVADMLIQRIRAERGAATGT